MEKLYTIDDLKCCGNCAKDGGMTDCKYKWKHLSHHRCDEWQYDECEFKTRFKPWEA